MVEKEIFVCFFVLFAFFCFFFVCFFSHQHQTEEEEGFRYTIVSSFLHFQTRMTTTTIHTDFESF